MQWNLSVNREKDAYFDFCDSAKDPEIQEIFNSAKASYELFTIATTERDDKCANTGLRITMLSKGIAASFERVLCTIILFNSLKFFFHKVSTHYNKIFLVNCKQTINMLKYVIQSTFFFILSPKMNPII